MAKVKRIARPLVRTAVVELLKGVVLGPREIGAPGDVYEVPKHQATALVFAGQAKYRPDITPDHDELPTGEKSGLPGDEYETATIEAPTSRDPHPKKRG